jgi:hypothetical protein
MHIPILASLSKLAQPFSKHPKCSRKASVFAKPQSLLETFKRRRRIGNWG